MLGYDNLRHTTKITTVFVLICIYHLCVFYRKEIIVPEALGFT